MTSPEDARRILRSQGLCGYVADGRACILLPGHDEGKHDRGWTVEKRVEADPYAHDSRASITTYRVSDGTKAFSTGSKEHADWLVEALTRREAASSVPSGTYQVDLAPGELRDLIRLIDDSVDGRPPLRPSEKAKDVLVALRDRLAEISTKRPGCL